MENSQTATFGYDSLKLNIPIARGQQAEIASCSELEHRCVVQYKNGSVSYLSNLRNLVVRIREKSLTISGSFAKYINGQNVDTLSPEDLGITVDLISKQLGVNLRWATVTRIDVALTAKMEFPAPAYLQLFLPSSRYGLNRSQENTIYIQSESRTRSLAAYDKAAESSLAGNTLRVELRLTKRPGMYIGKDESLFADDLTELAFFLNVKRAFKTFFEANILRRAEHMDALSIKNLKDLEQYALDRLLKDSDARQLLASVIEQQYRDKKIPHGNIDRLRKALRTTGTSDQSLLLQELTDKAAAPTYSGNPVLDALQDLLADDLSSNTTISSSPEGKESTE
jgi:hypothetical protein